MTPPPSEDVLTIRSFRVVFDLERRIHRIDRFRVPLPYGLPIRSLAYGAGALLAVILSMRLPAIGALMHVLPAPARLVIVPAAASYVMTRVRLDGRSAHAAAVAWALFKLAPHDLVAFRRKRSGPVELADVAFVDDGRTTAKT